MASLRAGFPSGDLPPIEAYEVGGAYFVADGHHRVALAMQRGADYIDAEVTRLETNYEIGPDTDVCQLIHTEQQLTLLHESGLAEARPDAVIEFSRPGGYAELLELIKAHGYDLARRRGAVARLQQEVAGRLVRPRLPAWGRSGSPRGACPRSTPTRPTPTCSCGSTSVDAPCGWIARRPTSRTLPASAAEVRISARDRRRFLREKSTPLRRRTPSARPVTS